jgi:hypothetical protein
MFREINTSPGSTTNRRSIQSMAFSIEQFFRRCIDSFESEWTASVVDCPAYSGCLRESSCLREINCLGASDCLRDNKCRRPINCLRTRNRRQLLNSKQSLLFRSDLIGYSCEVNVAGFPKPRFDLTECSSQKEKTRNSAPSQNTQQNGYISIGVSDRRRLRLPEHFVDGERMD